jgi:hypothetical protein
VPGAGARRWLDAAALTDAYARYERDLVLLGLNDAQVAASYSSGRLRRMFLWAMTKVVVAAPFAAIGAVGAVGAVVQVVPYQIMKKVGTLPTNEGVKATVKLLGCFASFPLLHIALGVVFGMQFGPGAGIAAFVAAPACGYMTVLFSERVKRVGGAVAGLRAVRDRSAAIESVLSRRRAAVELAQRAVDASRL